MSIYKEGSLSPPWYHRQDQGQWHNATSTQKSAFSNNKQRSPNVKTGPASAVNSHDSRILRNKYSSTGIHGQNSQNSLSYGDMENRSIYSSNVISTNRRSRHSLMQISSRGSSMTSMSSTSSGLTSASPQSCLSSTAMLRCNRNSSMFLSSRGSPISTRRLPVPPSSYFS